MTDTDTNPNALIHAMRNELHRLLYNEGPGSWDRDNTCEDERNVRSWNADGRHRATPTRGVAGKRQGLVKGGRQNPPC